MGPRRAKRFSLNSATCRPCAAASPSRAANGEATALRQISARAGGSKGCAVLARGSMAILADSVARVCRRVQPARLGRSGFWPVMVAGVLWHSVTGFPQRCCSKRYSFWGARASTAWPFAPENIQTRALCSRLTYFPTTVLEVFPDPWVLHGAQDCRVGNYTSIKATFKAAVVRPMPLRPPLSIWTFGESLNVIYSPYRIGFS